MPKPNRLTNNSDETDISALLSGDNVLRFHTSNVRARQVHEYDIADLLGHTVQSVTGTYARSTPEALEDAVNRLTEPRGTVIQLKRKAS